MRGNTYLVSKVTLNVFHNLSKTNKVLLVIDSIIQSSICIICIKREINVMKKDIDYQNGVNILWVLPYCFIL